MAHREFESSLSAAEWETLRTSVVLVCREGLRALFQTDANWDKTEQALLLLGRRAQSTGKGDDLALSLLADLADDATRKLTVARARETFDQVPESKLRRKTEEAAEIVDRKCPEQSFRFRATLALVSMFASGELR
ncbi:MULTISPECIES: hypothetical protein [unclassified Mesorhizobium]|uniref:hypothetical protein n=1 Tax=unclassified Mesorhizobium TaxID=325217 RepID=UPI000F75F93A|nr:MULTISPECIES: hypothetical protein [unclassified Mesorhizobium]AZO54739.1 hypothetical protein EJ077_15685 [Mesorhizobium sp. M8A.F.Ca.ET.057.01.1.1]RWE44341.1 MAG: hypothetical protein EOS80_20655 [Mesorhizobium sp.]